MKKAMFLVGILFFGLGELYSQSINDVPIKDIDVEHVEIVGTSKVVGSKMNIDIDFGQQNKLFLGTSRQIKDSDGKSMEFSSMIDALNFMSKSGYEFVQAYVVTINNQVAYHYLLRKKKQRARPDGLHISKPGE